MIISMKRHIKSVMIALCAVIAISCIKDSDNSCQTMTLTTITASACSDSADTKTVLDGKTLKSSWLEEDAINVFFGSSISSKFICQNAGEVAQFKGSIDVVTGGGEGLDDDTSLWGVYPYNENTICDGNSITYTLPGIQEAKADTFADDLFPTIARSRNFYMAFYNVCGSFRFTVANPDIVKVTIKGNLNEEIAGRARISMEGVPEVIEILDGVSELSMEAPEDGFFEAGKDYYFALYPTDFKSGVTLTFYKENSKAEFVYESPYDLGRNKYARFRDKDADLTFESRTLNNWEEGETIGGEI